MPAPECRFKLQLSTALFMYGAGKQPELRPSGIVGVLRYWLRAVAAGITDEKGIREIEADLLGSDDQEIGQRLIILAPGASGLDKREKFLLPHKPHKNPHDKNSKEKRNPKRALIGNHCFEIVLRAHGAPYPERRIEILSAVFWLGIHLGGFGQRARRGAGSLQLVTAPTGLPDATIPASSEELANRIANVIELAQNAIRGWKSGLGRPPAQPLYPALAANHACIEVATLTTNVEEDARRQIMKIREDPAVDPSHSNFAFGNGVPRFASPLHVHLGPWGQDHDFVFVVATWFHASRPRELPGTAEPAKVDAFLNQLGGVPVKFPTSPSLPAMQT